MRLNIVLLLAALLLAAAPDFAHADGDGYQQYYRHVSNYPHDDENGFSGEANGIAHDENYWYITNNDFEDVEALWKIPVGVELEGIQSSTPGVSVLRSDQISCPTEDGPKMLRGDLHYDHLGDLVAYKANDQKYYLLVPIEGGTPGPAIAVFRADNHNLQCLGFDVLWIDIGREKKNDAAAWCAVDSEGYVYTSPDFWNFAGDPEVKLFKYSLNWDEIASALPKLVKLTYQESILLLNESGQLLPADEISGYAQGGEFSSDGKLLYVSSGGGNDEGEEYGGIHVFDKETWRRVARSHENSFFQYDWGGEEEPEGLTIWDLDEGRKSYWDPPRAPYIGGQLHVLLLNNDWASRDNIYIYHYTNMIYVDHSYAGDPNGTIGRPYRTVGDALALYNQHEYFDHGHWTGGRIKIHTGSYAEALTFSRRVQLAPWGGQATVGLQGRLALTPEGTINIETGGALRIY